MSARNTENTDERRSDRAERRGDQAAALRGVMSRLQSDMDQYAQSFATWQCGRGDRERQANVRLHVIEAQLARLKGSDTMEAQDLCPVDLPGDSQPVVFSIAAYRT